MMTTIQKSKCQTSPAWLRAILKNMKPEDEPFALKTLCERQRRIAMLNQSHIELLARTKAKYPEKNRKLCADFDGGITIGQLAHKYQRTNGSIQSRLVRLGKIQPTLGEMNRRE